MIGRVHSARTPAYCSVVTLAFLLLCAACAIVDWVAVARHQRGIELVAKPLTLVLLIVAAASADLGHAKPWIVIALALGLLGDVSLMFSDEAGADRGFLAGLAAFLIGHIAYAVAFARHGVHSAQPIAGALVVAGTCALLAPRVLRAARERGGAVWQQPSAPTRARCR